MSVTISTQNNKLENDDLLISIVIPVYKGEQTIGRLVDQLVAELVSEYIIEIVLVNDNSPDNSGKVCQELHRKYNNIVNFYSLSKNVGEHNAVMAGLNNANGDYVVIMDDDFQNPIKEVRRLVAAAVGSKHDVVYTYYERKQQSALRNFGSWFNDKVANIMLKKPKDLYLSSFKVMNRFVVNEIIKYHLPFPYIDGLILRVTDNIGKIKVEHHRRGAGKSGYTAKKLVFLWLNMFTNFSIVPLRIATFLGLAFSLLGFIFGAVIIIEKIIYPDLPIGWPWLAVSIAIFSGVQLIALGMIGEYVGRIFLSLSRQPQFNIRERHEIER